jgi:DNA gyrase/topoisomerase IV subunit B
LATPDSAGDDAAVVALKLGVAIDKLSACERRVRVSIPREDIDRYRDDALGEMMPAELWSTTMDPGRRMLKQVTAEDAAEADRLLSVLMGNAIGPRKAFITEHADLIDWSLIDL